MDSSLPVLVSRLPDRHALALLVRAALRNEVAQVELDAGPQRAEAHTLDLHVSGQPPLALLAEPAGNPQNGTFPLRLRPLYRAQAPQLYALLAAENVSLDEPKGGDTKAFGSAPAPLPPHAPQPLTTRTLAMKQHDPSNPARVQIRRTSPAMPDAPEVAPRFASGAVPRSEPMLQAAANMNTPRPLPARHPSTLQGIPPAPGAPAPPVNPRHTAPSASWTVPEDPRRTIPSTSWNAQRAASLAPPTSPDPMRHAETDDDPHGADADDPSLSVSVVFEPDDLPPEVKAARLRSGNTAALAAPPVSLEPVPTAPETDQDPFPPEPSEPGDVDEDLLSVSVVFEPDALPPGITAGIPSPLGDDSPATVAEMPPSGGPNTIAEMSPVAGLSIDLEAPADATPQPEPAETASADDFNGFFDDFPSADFPSADPPDVIESEDEMANAMAAIDAMDSVQRVAAAEAVPTDDVDSGGTQAMAHAPVATLEDFPDMGELPPVEPIIDGGKTQIIGEPMHEEAAADGADAHEPTGEFEANFDINATQFPTDAELQLVDAIEDSRPEPIEGLQALVELPAPPVHHDEPLPLAPIPPPLDDDDDDATLIRLPPKTHAKKPAEPVVRPEARAKSEHTPTKETEIGIQETQVPPESQRQRLLEGPRPGARTAQPSLSDEADTAALKKAPVPPPSPSSDPHDPNDPAIGRRIADSKYVIESLIGAGAAGAVYRATHRELRRTVAIKLLHPHYQQDPHFMTSFRGEALAASQLDHPNVMRVLDFGQEPDGLVYIVMEFLSGRTLQQRLDEERRLPTEKAVEVMIQVCAALSVAHDHGIIHRDIKPDNIMLVPSRNDEGTTFELVKVCDFGIAALQNPRAEDADLSANEHVIAGTPEYMSPEQARGAPVDARADVYACGICLYELVTGRPPFLGNNPAEILIKQLDEAPQPPSAIVKGLDPIIEEIILRAIQKDPKKRHQSAREMRVEMKELVDITGEADQDDEDELSIVENVAMLDDPASGFPGFFIAFSSAVLRFGRFERGHNESTQAMKELQKQVRVSLRGRTEMTFARRDSGKTPGFVVMSGTAEIVDLKKLLGSQLMGSFGEPFIAELVKKGIASMTLREGIPDVELHYLIEMLLGPFAHEELRKELLSKPLRNISVLFVTDVVGRDRKLSWKVGLCAARLARDLRALCNIRGISLKKMREIRDELIGGIARLLTRGDEVKQFIFNGDLVDEAVANLRGFSSFQVAPLIIDRILHESCAEAATLLLHDLDAASLDEQERIRPFLTVFAQRLVTERSPKSDAAVAEFYRRKIVSDEDMPRDLKEQIRAASLADALVRDPSQFLRTLDSIRDPQQYEDELSILETAMGALGRRAEATPLMAVMSMLSHHAKTPGPREKAALRTMKWMIDAARLAPIANTVLTGPAQQQTAARQLLVLAGSVGVTALYAAREATEEPAARQNFIQVLRDTGPAGWSFMAQTLTRLEVAGDHELALVEDLLRAMPDRADPVLGEAVAKFLPHPQLRQTALQVIVPLWGERAKKPLVEALEYADEPTRIVALGELRKLHAIDEYVFSVIERFLTMKGSAGEDLRIAAAAALADAATPVRARAIQMLTKVVEGKRGLVALIRGTGADEETAGVLESMGRALLALDRNEGMKALKGRVSRSDGATKQRLQALLQSSS